ncbi:hypothetical protein COB21_02175 [Candidatus Aerophobetes bacterium]|uniref:Uncharacterized protein n=1 Tax=Aerophobetes bacterium TaxID=2030807 RepID=A0A2A4X5T2_UNCAE|nr:MAG: hypothetical protein COB21_02175 [Candidatus Aerophobetes bacterium]
MDFFQKLIWDIGESLDLPLHADENRNCKLILEEKMAMQLALSDCDTYVIVALFIAEIPPGAFRINVLETALNENYKSTKLGYFSYSKKYNALVLENFYEKIHLHDGKELANELEKITELGLVWHTAILSGNLHSIG